MPLPRFSAIDADDEGSKKKKPDQRLKPYNFPGIGKPIDL